jgi:hypothetical protein
VLEAGPLSIDEFTSIRERWAAVATAAWSGQR